MGIYKQKFNPISGQFNLVSTATSMVFKDAVDSFSNLPPTGNSVGDARFTTDTGHLYIWDGATWVDQGDIIDYPTGGLGVIQDNIASLDADETKIITHASDSLYKRFVQLLMQLQVGISIFFNVGTEPNFDYDPNGIVFNEIGTDGFSLSPILGAEGMVAYYIFNSNVIDSVDSHNGTNHGVTFSTGIVEKQADFDGASYIDIPNSSDLIPGTADDMFAIEFWLSNNPPDGEIISLWNETDNRRSWRLYIDSNKIKMDISEDGTTVAGTWEITNALNTYYGDLHIGLMRSDATEIKSFVNGTKTLPHSYPGSGAAFNNTIDPIRIGAKGGTVPSNFLTGSLSELAIYKGFDFDQYDGMYSNYFQSHMAKNTTGEHLSQYNTLMEYVKTNSLGQIDTSSWVGIKTIGFNGDFYGDFQVAVLFSFDGGTTWKLWNGSSWDTVSESTPGCTISGLPTTKLEWDLVFVPGTLDYLIQLQTNNPSYTPTVFQMYVNSLRPGYMDATGTIKFRYLSDTETEIRNGTSDYGSPETIYDIKTNIIL